LKESDIIELANCYFCIGRNNYFLGNLNKAIKAYDISLQIKTELFGYNYINLAGIYNSIGNVYQQNGKLDQALEMYMKCLNIQRAEYGE
jgi:tetratricopeptide (TPR) repeat protein